ncbi:hypothetical protein M9458_048958 [Cirrhinus mrigala]|uniref:Uncharacterized protein n=1 Tax=Cirrhinus mrigala TaxID=683832 RepID=A0ABD0N089_CIRMR
MAKAQLMNINQRAFAVVASVDSQTGHSTESSRTGGHKLRILSRPVHPVKRKGEDTLKEPFSHLSHRLSVRNGQEKQKQTSLNWSKARPPVQRSYKRIAVSQELQRRVKCVQTGKNVIVWERK